MKTSMQTRKTDIQTNAYNQVTNPTAPAKVGRNYRVRVTLDHTTE